MRRGAALLCALVAAVLAVAGAPACAQAAAADCATVHLGPDLGAGAGAGYFSDTLSAGESRTLRVLVANPSDSACTVALHPAAGRTATNSGDTYVDAAPGDWVHDLPATVELPAGARRDVAFRVVVPADAGAGQHLVGVIGEPGASGAPAADSGVAVHVTTRVAIGVAVTVPGPLRPALDVPSVTVTVSGAQAVLHVEERDGGNTWEHPVGSVVVEAAGHEVRLPVRSNTVLPGGRAVLPVAAVGVPAGTWPVRVRLGYGSGLVATWSGALRFEPPAVARHGDVLTITTEAAAPAALYWLLGGLGGLLVVAVAVIVVLLVRRRPGPGMPA